MAEVSWRYATAADMREFYDGEIPATVQAVAIDIDGKPVCVIGLACVGPHKWLFSDERPEFDPYRRRMPVMRALKRVQEWIRASALTVLSESKNRELLERLGFKQTREEDVFQWQD